MHTKFCVIDAQKVITGSANWTDFGLANNFEDLLIFKDIKLANHYLNSLESLKKHLKPYKFTQSKENKRYRMPDKKEYTISKSSKSMKRSRNMRIYKIKKSPQIYFSPLQNPMSNIIKAINNAKKTIDVAMFTLSTEELIESLLKAKKRGVRINLIVDESMHISSYRRVLQKFFDSGIKISYYHNDYGIMHLKVVIIDEKIIWRGSGN